MLHRNLHKSVQMPLLFLCYNQATFLSVCLFCTSKPMSSSSMDHCHWCWVWARVSVSLCCLYMCIIDWIHRCHFQKARALWEPPLPRLSPTGEHSGMVTRDPAGLNMRGRLAHWEKGWTLLLSVPAGRMWTPSRPKKERTNRSGMTIELEKVRRTILEYIIRKACECG